MMAKGKINGKFQYFQYQITHFDKLLQIFMQVGGVLCGVFDGLLFKSLKNVRVS